MNFYKKYIPKEIRILTTFSVVLILIRIILSDSLDFIYLFWNIFLAFIPFVISIFLLTIKKEDKNYLFFLILGGILWLIFFPNAPYLLTDMIHIREGVFMPMWYDGLIFLSISFLGLILSFNSLGHIEQILSIKYSKKTVSLISTFIIFLSSFGVYLGRFLRLNSWDLIIRIRETTNIIYKIIKNPIIHIQVYIFTIAFFLFFLIFFHIWKFIKESKSSISMLN